MGSKKEDREIEMGSAIFYVKRHKMVVRVVCIDGLWDEDTRTLLENFQDSGQV